MEEKEISLGKIFKVAFRRWKLLLVLTLSIGVAGSLAILFGYNTLKGYYSSEFSYSAPNLAVEKYSDGSSFYFKNLLSYENLKSIKESDEQFSSIDIDTMVKRGEISIAKNTELISENKASYSYTIKMNYRYCKNNEVAKNFITAIAEQPIAKDKYIVSSDTFNTSLKMFDSASTFEQQVDLLNSQASSFKLSYENMLKSDTISSLALELVNSNLDRINKLVPESFSKDLKRIINLNGYVKDYEAQESKNLEVDKAALSEEKAYNDYQISALNAEIGKLTALGAPVSTLSEEVVKLTLRNGEIDYEIVGIDNKLKNKGKKPEDIPGYNDFVVLLNFYKDELYKCVDSYKNVLNVLYVQDATVAFKDSDTAKLKGVLSTPVAIVLSIAAGFIVGFVTNLIVDRKLLKE